MPRRPFRDTPYLRLLSAVLDSNQRFIGIDKSRQMMVSWEISAFLLHHAMFHPASEILIMSKRGEDSNYMIDRLMAIYRNQPDFLQQFSPAVRVGAKISFRNRSNIAALPSEAHQINQYQAKKVWFDECSLHEDFMNKFNAARPMIDSAVAGASAVGRQIICSSTPAGHVDWWELLKDVPPDNLMPEELN